MLYLVNLCWVLLIFAWVLLAGAIIEYGLALMSRWVLWKSWSMVSMLFQVVFEIVSQEYKVDYIDVAYIFHLEVFKVE